MPSDMDLIQRLDRDIQFHEARARKLRNTREILFEYLSEPEVQAPATITEEASEAPPSINGGRYSNPRLTLQGVAESCLLEVRQPMQPRDIADALLKRGLPYAKGRRKLANSLGAMLRRSHKEGGQFIRVDTGEYGLREWTRPGGAQQEEIGGLE